MTALQISNVSIRQSGALFNLNDLHKASGGEKRHRPNYWLELQQTKELIDELNSENPKAGIPALKENQDVITVIHGGANRGTFVCKELVYAYATWISPKFFLVVIRAYDNQIVSGTLKPYSIAPEQTLSAEEADMLRKLITEHAQTLTADQRADFIIKGWSKLKAHFGVSYRQIPQSQFTEAISIVGRHMAELPAPIASQKQSLNELVADLTEKLLEPNGYGYMTFMPLYHAIQKKIDQTSYMLVNRQHIVDLFNDLGKLRSRVDVLGKIKSDHPDEWWQQKRIAG